ncbi:hypothetical protein KCU99_g10054, partial [Aureobasidium melanogenum]|jgi:hypothetical protein
MSTHELNLESEDHDRLHDSITEPSQTPPQPVREKATQVLLYTRLKRHNSEVNPGLDQDEETQIIEASLEIGYEDLPWMINAEYCKTVKKLYESVRGHFDDVLENRQRNKTQAIVEISLITQYTDFGIEDDPGNQPLLNEYWKHAADANSEETSGKVIVVRIRDRFLDNQTLQDTNSE